MIIMLLQRLQHLPKVFKLHQTRHSLNFQSEILFNLKILNHNIDLNFIMTNSKNNYILTNNNKNPFCAGFFKSFERSQYRL